MAGRSNEKEAFRECGRSFRDGMTVEPRVVIHDIFS